jgi:glycosyltransferase involved in cell wall biosynthesis
MKILYDHQILGGQIYGGISRYYFELMDQYYRMQNPQFELSLVYSKTQCLNLAAGKRKDYFFKKPGFRFRFTDKSTVNRVTSEKKIAARGFDIFHPTYYDPYFVEYLDGSPFVLTVYDMIHERYAGQYSSRDKTAEHKKYLLPKADRIIAISENTKKDILYYYPEIQESKITMTHLASSIVKEEAQKPRAAVPSRYILFVGGRGRYKNFQILINSARDILAKDKDLHVVCAGSEPFKPSESQMFTGLGIQKQVHHIPVEDSSLIWLYCNALVFVFPSLYEGFGIPVLEAFACGCPVICSNISSLPEVADNAAEYIDPQSESSVRQVLDKVIYNESLRRQMTTLGYERLKCFSWKNTALQTLDIYRSLL